MSGGSFDYEYSRISQFADELKQMIESNNRKDEFGYAQNFNSKTIELLSTSQKIIATPASELAREVEWLYSGDHGEESFTDLVNRILAGK
ncbi:MAG: hypothetical protein JRC91_04875 [Deltaproteobacteria bacterium]|nr:hypothetical protein [Deltaproteobacteria bacterium]